jgi:hypothetical protein
VYENRTDDSEIYIWNKGFSSFNLVYETVACAYSPMGYKIKN